MIQQSNNIKFHFHVAPMFMKPRAITCQDVCFVYQGAHEWRREWPWDTMTWKRGDWFMKVNRKHTHTQWKGFIPIVKAVRKPSLYAAMCVSVIVLLPWHTCCYTLTSPPQTQTQTHTHTHILVQSALMDSSEGVPTHALTVFNSVSKQHDLMGRSIKIHVSHVFFWMPLTLHKVLDVEDEVGWLIFCLLLSLSGAVYYQIGATFLDVSEVSFDPSIHCTVLQTLISCSSVHLVPQSC